MNNCQGCLTTPSTHMLEPVKALASGILHPTRRWSTPTKNKNKSWYFASQFCGDRFYFIISYEIHWTPQSRIRYNPFQYYLQKERNKKETPWSQACYLTFVNAWFTTEQIHSRQQRLSKGVAKSSKYSSFFVISMSIVMMNRMDNNLLLNWSECIG